jgi:hypothetical protein
MKEHITRILKQHNDRMEQALRQARRADRSEAIPGRQELIPCGRLCERVVGTAAGAWSHRLAGPPSPPRRSSRSNMRRM